MSRPRRWFWALLVSVLAGCGPQQAPKAPVDECRSGKPSPRKQDGVVVMGEVHSPRRIPWRCGLTAADAIAAAGGFSAFASPAKTMISRNSPHGKQRFQVDDERRLNLIVLARGDVVVAQASGLGY